MQCRSTRLKQIQYNLNIMILMTGEIYSLITRHSIYLGEPNKLACEKYILIS